ncbi:MAG TPA: TolC family protein [Oculatellaceae cyanobacterium]|jgi:cobalt-zinc-cadmium efflux system outer membrane protein
MRRFRIRRSSKILAKIQLVLVFSNFCQAPAYAQQISPADAGMPTKLDASVSQSDQAMSLPDLQKFASQSNPTLLQANAAIEAARGRAKQAGLPPNPVFGFEGAEWAFRGWNQKAEYFGFFEQTVPLGGKLKKARQIYVQEAKQAEIEALAQKFRIENSVRIAFYEALGAQQQVDINTELLGIAQTATSTTSELFNVGQADKPDFLQAEIELEEVKHDLVVAQNTLNQNLKELAAVVNRPLPASIRLIGDLDTRIPEFDETAKLNEILNQSPQIRAAEVQVARAKAVLARAKVEPYPDMFLRSGFGYSSEFLDTGGSSQSSGSPRRTGAEMNMQVGLSLPLWNRNQGGIATAKAELAFAQNEYNRLRLGLGMRFAQTRNSYANSIDKVRRYKAVILPKAEEAYRMYFEKYKTMSAAYPQVIISQRTLFQARRQYIMALVDLRQTATQLEGFLLTGALDAPAMRQDTTGMNQFELSGAPSAIRTGHDNGADTAGLVEY